MNEMSLWARTVLGNRAVLHRLGRCGYTFRQVTSWENHIPQIITDTQDTAQRSCLAKAFAING